MATDATGNARAQIVESVCERVIAGESIAEVFRDPSPGFPSYATFWRWLAKDEALSRLVADAELAGCNALADRIIDVSRTTRIGEIVTDSEKDGRTVRTVDMVERSKLEVHALQWVLARRMPKRFGDRTILAGDADNPIRVADESGIAGKLLPELAAAGSPGPPRQPDEG